MNDKDQCCESDQAIPSLQDSMKKPLKFKDCGLEEQIARLHGEICNMRHTISYFHRENEELRMKINLLRFHQHAINGDCVVRVEDKLAQNQLRGSGIGCTSTDYLA